MKMKLAFAAAFVLFTLQSQARNGSAVRPHLGLLSTAEVRQVFDSHVASFATVPADQKAVLDAGQRVYEWINLVNKHRGALAPLSYSDPSTMTNPSMDHPKIYDAQTGPLMFADILKDMPQIYRDLVTGQGSLPTALPIPEDQFLELGLRVTNAYDITARWILMQAWLFDLKAERVNDMRGYVSLLNLKDRDLKLKAFSSLPADEKTLMRTWLVDVCLNTQLPSRMDVAKCRTELATAETQTKVADYYQRYNAGAKQNYDSFFTLDSFWIRPDIVWTSKDASTVHYPFLQIADNDVAAYFKNNVEDEWRGNGWKLSIDFTNQTRFNLSHLEYQPNATAHAEPNKIVMDEYEPRTEYLSQWTIRHEFGHLLGFKDCYVEFFDEDVNKIVNYPLDPTNIMCSRRGHIQPQHFDVLKTRYFKP